MTSRRRRGAPRSPRCYARVDDEVTAELLRPFLNQEVWQWSFLDAARILEPEDWEGVDSVARDQLFQVLYGADVIGPKPRDQLIVMVNKSLRKIAASDCSTLEVDVLQMSTTVEEHVGSCIPCQLLVDSESFRYSRTPAVLRLLMQICREHVYVFAQYWGALVEKCDELIWRRGWVLSASSREQCRLELTLNLMEHKRATEWRRECEETADVKRTDLALRRVLAVTQEQDQLAIKWGSFSAGPY
ncbi:hypothetical protein ACWDCC_42030 [Streptomyces sp. NPDC001102]